MVAVTTPSILLVLPEVFGNNGGIQMFNRSLCLATERWAGTHAMALRLVVLNDSGSVDRRYLAPSTAYFGAHKRKGMFLARVMREVAQRPHRLLVVGHVSFSPLILAATLLRRRLPVCVITYGIEVWQPLKALERAGLRRAAKVIAVSEFTRNQVLQHNGLDPARVAVVGCPLDPFWPIQAAEPVRRAGVPILLTVARLTAADAYKGVDSVIRALPKVVSMLGPVEYRVVGAGDDIPRLRQLAAEIGVGPTVTFLGAVGEAELASEYRSCNVFVMPSEKEGFGIVFLEAMAFGKPVIGGAHGGTPDVIADGENGFLVNRLDVSALSDRIVELLGDRALAQRLGQQGRSRALREFSFDQFQHGLAPILALATT